MAAAAWAGWPAISPPASRSGRASARRRRFEEHRLAALHAIEQRLLPLQERRALLEGELTAVRARRFERTGFWNYFARRRLDAEQAVLVAARQSVDEQIERYERARHDKLKEEAPLPDDIGVEGKRLVNLSVIALAQELLLAFSEHDVATLARDASLRQVSEVSYGTLQACRDLSQRIEGVLRKVEAMDELAGRVRRRAEFLRQTVSYRRDSDTVPAPDGLAVDPGAADPETASRGPPAGARWPSTSSLTNTGTSTACCCTSLPRASPFAARLGVVRLGLGQQRAGRAAAIREYSSAMFAAVSSRGSGCSSGLSFSTESTAARPRAVRQAFSRSSWALRWTSRSRFRASRFSETRCWARISSDGRDVGLQVPHVRGCRQFGALEARELGDGRVQRLAGLEAGGRDLVPGQGAIAAAFADFARSRWRTAG